MKRTSLLSFALVAVLALSMGCSHKPNDAKISADIQAKYAQDSGLSTKQLSVESVNGVVTISGTVDNTAQRDAASRQASSEPGVTQVVNNLVVGNAPAVVAASTPPPVPTKPTANTSAPPTKPAAQKSAKKDPQANQASDDANSSQDTANDQPPADPQPATPAETPAPAPPPPSPGPKQLIIDQGTTLAVRLIEPIDTEKNQVGDTFHATLNTPLSSDGEEAVPAGVELTGHIVDVKSASKFAGKSVLVLQLDILAYGGKNYNLQTDQYKKEGKARGKNTAEKVGGGAVLGTIIGAVAGGGKGAAIGAAAGAGAGGVAQAASKSQAIKLPSETVLNFTLQEPVTVLKPLAPDANRPKLADPPQN